MLFNKANQKILQDLDDRGTTSQRMTSMENKLPPKKTNEIPDKSYGDSSKTFGLKWDVQHDLLRRKLMQLQREKMALTRSIQTKEQRLKIVMKEKELKSKQLLEAEKAKENLQKENENLKNKLKIDDRTDYWKGHAKNVNQQEKKLHRKIQDLEQSLAKEKMIMRVLQDHIEKHFSRERHSTRNDVENYDLLKKYTTLQKMLQKKVKELNEKELLILEKDKMLEKLKNSEVRTVVNELLGQSAGTRKKLKEKDREIRILMCQVNMRESVTSAYKHEIDRLKQLLGDKTVSMQH